MEKENIIESSSVKKRKEKYNRGWFDFRTMADQFAGVGFDLLYVHQRKENKKKYNRGVWFSL